MIYQAFLEISSTLCDPFTHQLYGLPLYECIAELRSQMKDSNTLAEMDLDKVEEDYDETKKEKLVRLMRAHGGLSPSKASKGDGVRRGAKGDGA